MIKKIILYKDFFNGKEIWGFIRKSFNGYVLHIYYKKSNYTFYEHSLKKYFEIEKDAFLKKKIRRPFEHYLGDKSGWKYHGKLSALKEGYRIIQKLRKLRNFQ